jgi:AmmeMemoRadiSam system protein B
MDRRTAERIIGSAGLLASEDACGAEPINGLLVSTRKRGLRPALLDLRNSGDTAGSRGEVVGYGAFAFYEGDDDQ